MKDRKNQPLDPIQRAAHYNSHPSGVEAIDVVEDLPFNLGNAWKYLQRADEKGATLQDLGKALWYIRREMTRHRIRARSRLLQEVNVRSSVGSSVKKYLRHESGLRREVFSHLWSAYTLGAATGVFPNSLFHLGQAELIVQELIREKGVSA